MYTINRIPSPTTHNKSPFELLYSQTPNYSFLRVFGCACFVSLPPHERTKLQPHTRLYCFLGYGVSQKGFHCYDPISHHLHVSRHVEFCEYHPFMSLQQFPVSSSSKSPIFTDLFLPLYPELVEDSSTSAASLDDSSPILSPVYDPPVLDPVAPPFPEPLVGPKLRHSTRESILPPCEETFALVARLTSVRCLIAVAAVRRWPLYQMVVKNAFLNGDLHEKVYMQPPPGYPHSGSQVCRLHRALYGLEQAPQAWFKKFSSIKKVSLRVLMTLLSLSKDPLLVSLLFFFMLMI